MPVLVVLAISLPWVRRTLTFAAGVAAAFLASVLPFAVQIGVSFVPIDLRLLTPGVLLWHARLG